MIGAVAAFFRSWLYTLAGQSIVARLRKDVSGFLIHRNEHWAKIKFSFENLFSEYEQIYR